MTFEIDSRAGSKKDAISDLQQGDLVGILLDVAFYGMRTHPLTVSCPRRMPTAESLSLRPPNLMQDDSFSSLNTGLADLSKSPSIDLISSSFEKAEDARRSGNGR